MGFIVDFNWASQAILETVGMAFPSLEAPQGVVVGDPPTPALRPGGLGPVHVALCGNGRWQKDSSDRFNCGCNIDVGIPAQPGDKGILSAGEMERLYTWFQQRYPTSRTSRLSTAAAHVSNTPACKTLARRRWRSG
jgi:hypothetical protein